MPLNIEKSTSVTDALNSRITVRDFLDRPVPQDVLKTLFETAQRSPSGGNLQPWHVHVMTDDKLETFKEDALARAQAGKTDVPTYRPYPCLLYTSPSPRDS